MNGATFVQIALKLGGDVGFVMAREFSLADANERRCGDENDGDD